MELTFIPNKDDYSALFRYVLNTAVNRRQRFKKALFAPAMFFAGYVVSRFFSSDVLPISYYVGEALLAGSITTGWTWYRYKTFHRTAAKLHMKESPDVGKLQKFTISSQGIDITIAESNKFKHWNELYTIEITDDHIFIDQQYVIPKWSLGELFAAACSEIKTHYPYQLKSATTP